MQGTEIEKYGAKFYTMDTDELEDPECFARNYDRLSKARREKIDTLHYMEDKRRSLGVGMLLKKGFLDYGLKGKEVVIACGPYGKPYLKNRPDIYFNVSHSGKKAAVVFAGTEVGCDIEQTRRANLAVAKRFFCPEEYEYVLRQPGLAEQNKAFYRMWTLKESFIKSVGLGLSLPLHAFEIRIHDGGKVSVCQHVDKAFYDFREYELDGGYLMALCFRSA